MRASALPALCEEACRATDSSLADLIGSSHPVAGQTHYMIVINDHYAAGVLHAPDKERQMSVMEKTVSEKSAAKRSSAQKPECRLVRAGDAFEGKQGLLYNVGISAETVGAQGIHMQLVTIPPGARAKAHKHADHETAIYALKGVSEVWYGNRLEHHAIVKPGDFFYIPANVPHLPYNPSNTEDTVALISRTDPNEQESVILLPELDKLHP